MLGTSDTNLKLFEGIPTCVVFPSGEEAVSLLTSNVKVDVTVKFGVLAQLLTRAGFVHLGGGGGGVLFIGVVSI